MRFTGVGVAVLLTVAPCSLWAQLTEDVLRQRIDAAQENPAIRNLIQATAAARLLGDYEKAETLLEQSSTAVVQAQNGVIYNTILLELASGGGVNGALRAFRDVRTYVNMAPQDIGAWANNLPILLVGGEFDEMIERFSPDAEDPLYRCNCYQYKAWMHRVAGRMDQSRIYWDSSAVEWENNLVLSDDPDARADIQAQFARNYARAGRHADARRLLEEAMRMPVSDEAMPGVRRRWAQAYAELGDVENAVEQIEYLLSIPTLMTVNTLESRVTWEPIRDHPAFQAMLDRHR